MATSSAVVVGSKKLELYFKKVQGQIIQQKLLKDIGHFIDLRIEERTLRGEDPAGGMLGSYSPDYTLVRQEKGLQTAFVDLFFTGSMYASLTHKVGKNEVTSFFMPTTDRTGARNPEKAFLLDTKYGFFALGFKDVKDIQGLVDNHIDQVMARG